MVSVAKQEQRLKSSIVFDQKSDAFCRKTRTNGKKDKSEFQGCKIALFEHETIFLEMLDPNDIIKIFAAIQVSFRPYEDSRTM